MVRWSTLLTALLLASRAMEAEAKSGKLNVPRVLLPLTEEGASYLLFSRGGCFTWKSTRPEIISVTPKPDCAKDYCEEAANELPATGPKCTSSAMVSVSGNLMSHVGKTQAVVMAEDYYAPGRILRSDVIVDVIKSLQIVTKTHELYLEEAPEEFSVRAYDEQGNEFSNLDGIIFKWNIIDKRSANIRFIKFKDSIYSIDPMLEKLESRGLQGCKVLLEGIKTGSAKVSVQLASKALNTGSVQPAEVNVLVVANLFLYPPVAFILPGASVIYHAEQIKSNQIQIINISSSNQYFLEVGDAKLVTVSDSDAAKVTSKSMLGSTMVTLRDHNVASNADQAGDVDTKSPNADLHIVEPDHIVIEIDPFKSWTVIVGQSYDIWVEVFDADNHKLQLSDNVVMQLEFQHHGYFNIQDSTRNGSWLNGTPIKSGSVQIRATLLGTSSHQLSSPLVAVANMDIYAPIVLKPQLSVFPWNALQTSYSVNYVIDGHESSYLWSSSNTSVSSVTQNGQATVNSQVVGENVIAAAMNRASHNFGTAVIKVMPATSLRIIRNQVFEAEVGQQLALLVSIAAQGQLAFTDCSQLPYSLKLSDKRAFSLLQNGRAPMDSELHQDSACTVPILKASMVGFSSLAVSYRYESVLEDQQLSPIDLLDEVPIAAYEPLKPVHPASGTAVLAADSSLMLMWSGGPQPWIKDPGQHFHELSIEGDDTLVEVGQRIFSKLVGPASRDQFLFHAVCKRIGQVSITLKVGNRASATLPRPVVAESTITIVCSEPSQLKLEARLPVPTAHHGLQCPLMAKHMGRISALCYENLNIGITVLDSEGRKFDNVSTLDISWDVSNANLATIAKKGILNCAETGAYQVLETKKVPGSLEVVASLRTPGSYLGFGKLSDSLPLNLVTDAVLDRDRLVVFNHPDNWQTISIKHGSGFFNVIHQSNDVISHIYHPANHTIAIRPLQTGTSFIRVQDLCLATAKVPEAQVVVSGIHLVELHMVDKVQQGKSVSASVKLLDQFGKAIPTAQMTFLQLNLTPDSKGVVRITSRPGTLPQDMQFMVHGEQLGHTSITAHALYGSTQVSSSPCKLNVFSSLKVEPKNVTLIIGAKFQVEVSGGPQDPESSVEFSVGNSKIAAANSVGLITAQALGHTSLVATAFGLDKATNKRIVLSEDTINVHVIKLEGIKIRAPVHHLVSGNTMPLTAVGLDGLHHIPFAFGSARPHLLFHWSSSNQEVAEVLSVFHSSNVGLSDVNTASVRLLAKKSGRVTIKLRVRISASVEGMNQYQLDRDREFTDQMEVHVLNSLVVKSSGSVCRNTIIMGPNSEFQIKTNYDFDSDSEMTYSLESNDDIVSLDKYGLIRSKEEFGTAVILVQVYDPKLSTEPVQQSIFIVQVKPIKYLMVNALQAFRPLPSGSILTFLPNGISISLEIGYYDSLGHRFHAVSHLYTNDVHLRPSRFDSNQIVMVNNTASVELLKQTFTVLGVRSTTSHLQDFVVFDVQRAIYPDVKKMVVGQSLALSSIVTSTSTSGYGYANGNSMAVITSDVQPEWIAEPVGIVKMLDAKLGVVTALKSGLARIAFRLNTIQRVFFDVEIEPATKLTLDPSQLGAGFHLTNAKEGVSIPVHILAAPQKQVATQGPAPAHDLAPSNKSGLVAPSAQPQWFQCNAKFVGQKVDLDKVISVQSGFDWSRGGHICHFKVTSDEFSRNFFSDSVELTVVASSALGNEVVGDKSFLPFVSEFRLSVQKLTVSSSVRSAELKIRGLSQVLQDVKVRSSHPDFFHIGSSYLQSADSFNAGSDGDEEFLMPVHVLVVPIKVKSAFFLPGSEQRSDLYLTVSSAMTNQKVNVPMDVALDEKCCQCESWSLNEPWLLASIVSAACIVVSLILYKRHPSAISLREPTANGAARPGTGATLAKVPHSDLMASPRLQPNRLSNVEERPYLFTVNNSPIYGSPDSATTSFYSRKVSPRPLTGTFSYDS